MKLADIRDPQTYYHVTHTRNVPAIHANGIQLKQTSNWMKQATGQRYGDGDVYTFEHKDDAVRWAGRMDYEFNKKLGSGGISIIEILPGEQSWEKDRAEPLGQAGSKGAWLKSADMVSPSQIKSSYPVTTDMIRKATKSG